MTFTLTGVRSLVAIVAIAGVTGTAATTASAASKPAGKHATRLHKKSAKKDKGGRADLVAGGLSADLTDGGFDVTASVANQGKLFAKSSDVVIALSDDATLDDDDEVLDEYHVAGVGSGVTRSFDDEVDIPNDIDADSMYLIVCADGNQEVAESNEANNCVSQLVDTSSANGDDGGDDGSDGGDDGSDDGSDTAPIVLIGGQS